MMEAVSPSFLLYDKIMREQEDICLLYDKIMREQEDI